MQARSPDVHDGIIVGAGAAGLMAALRAGSLGLKVALVDGGGGDSNLERSGGMFSAAGTRMQAALGLADDPAVWAAEIGRETGGAVDPVIVQLVTTRAADAAHLLAEWGLALHVVTGVVVGGAVPRLHATQAESGRELAEAMRAALRRMGGTVTHVAEEARGLVVEDGRVLGVQTARGTLRAPWTLLASGGFAANPAMLARFAPGTERAVGIGSPGNDGRGIGWAADLGAELLFMDSYQGQGHVTTDAAGRGTGRLGPGLGSFGAIVVNARGERFADETMSPSAFAAHVLAQPGGVAVEFFDRAAHTAALRFGPYREAVARGDVVEAEDAAGLAAGLGLPPELLAVTLAQWAAVAAGERSDPFGRTRALRALRAPFHAARVTGAVAHTQGGVRVDAMARVLDGTGQPIAGLLAAGGAAASVSGHGAAGYMPGNGLAQAFALGLAAAETMAAGSAG
jgi:fumarate reductase flavoprotein subunit